MDNQIQLLQNLYDDAIEEDLDFKYRVPFEKNEYYEIFDKSTWPVISDPANAVDAMDFKAIYELFELHFEYALFAKMKLKDEVIAQQYFAIASAYGVFATHYGVLCSPHIMGQQPFIPMNKATLILSNCILLNQQSNIQRVGNHLVDSLNKASSIMKRGQSNAHVAWFIMQLYINNFDKELHLNKALMPKDFELFQEVLDNWDTQDQQQLEKYIVLLADNHIAQARISAAVNLDNLENKTFNFSELFLPGLYLLPYEILVWLKFRQQHDLFVPDQFNHPLMNTSLVKELLDRREELSMPVSVPYVQLLLKKIKKQCALP